MSACWLGKKRRNLCTCYFAMLSRIGISILNHMQVLARHAAKKERTNRNASLCTLLNTLLLHGPGRSKRTGSDCSHGDYNKHCSAVNRR